MEAHLRYSVSIFLVACLIACLAFLVSTSSAASNNGETVVRDMYTENLDALDVCTRPAQVLCGRKSQASSITPSEFICLHKKAFRVTRNILPALDGTECEKTIKILDKEYESHDKTFSKSLAQIFEVHKELVQTKCASADSSYCGKLPAIEVQEFRCLWRNSSRVGGEPDTKYANSDCDKTVREILRRYRYKK